MFAGILKVHWHTSWPAWSPRYSSGPERIWCAGQSRYARELIVLEHAGGFKPTIALRRTAPVALTRFRIPARRQAVTDRQPMDTPLCASTAPTGPKAWSAA